MQKKYVVRLTDEERSAVQQVVKKLEGTRQKVGRAQGLLKADADGPNWTHRRIAEACSCRVQTVEKLRQRLVERGCEETFNGPQRKTPATDKLRNGEPEARVIGMRLGPPIPGYANGMLRLLACKLVELEIVESIGYETIRQTLKKWDDQPPNRVVGDPAGRGRRVCHRHGRSAENLRKTVRSPAPGRRLEGRHVNCENVILVCDNLPTHTKGTCYEAFTSERASQLVRRIAFRHIPKHGSWLNLAENELSALTRQCVSGRRFADVNTLQHETSARHRWSLTATSCTVQPSFQIRRSLTPRRIPRCGCAAKRETANRPSTSAGTASRRRLPWCRDNGF